MEMSSLLEETKRKRVDGNVTVFHGRFMEDML